MLQIIGNNTFDGNLGETDLWTGIDTDLYHWTKVLRPVQVFVMCFVYVCVGCCFISKVRVLIIPGNWTVVSWSYCKSRKGTEGTT